MTIQLIDTTTPDIGLKTVADKLNGNFTNSDHAASYVVGSTSGTIPTNDVLATGAYTTVGTASTVDTGTDATEVPTNANLSASVAGTATFSSDVYTFSTAGTGFRALQAGMYVSFKLPSGSANTTTTPDISYDGTTYVIKWIDGSALVADDLDETYNKQPLMFYFDGTDMLIASDISGDGWTKYANGCLEQAGTQIFTSLDILTSRGSGVYTNISSDGEVSLAKIFSGSVSDYHSIASVSSESFVSYDGITGIYQIENESQSAIRILISSLSSHTEPSINVSWSCNGRWY